MKSHTPTIGYSDTAILSSRSLFEKCPKAKPMFGYDLYADVDDVLLEDPKFIAHSMKLISMFDAAFAMLGPDGNLLEEEIKKLGEKHVAYGVQAEMFPIMGKALIAMLSDQLGDAFTDDLQKKWTFVFSAISEDLMITVLKSKGKASKLGANQNTSSAVTA